MRPIIRVISIPEGLWSLIFLGVLIDLCSHRYNCRVKITALVPSKLSSVRLREKNIQKLNGKPLLNYALSTLESIDSINKIVLQSSTEKILDYLLEDYSKLKFQKRPTELDLDESSPQDWIRYFCDSDDCDYVVLLHITSPFISAHTILECIESIKSSQFDSSFAAIKYQNFAWFKGEPLNYEVKKPIPRTQDLEPIIMEQTGLYLFGRKFFLKTNRRVGENPYIKFLNFPEYLDIDVLEDLELARFILQSGVYS